MIFEKYGPWALIAGGSDGLGAALADLLAEAGLNLVLVARRSHILDATAQRLRNTHGTEIRTIQADLRDAADLARIKENTQDIEVGMLVCNAGAGASSFLDFNEDTLGSARDMIALNILAPAELVHHFGTAMRSRGRGSIVLVGSMAGFVGSPKISVYAAAKSYTQIFAEGLWEEMRLHGVDVLGFIIGATNTDTLRRNIGVELEGLPQPEDVATECIDNLSNGPIHITKNKQNEAKRLQSMPRRAAVQETAKTSAMFTKFIAENRMATDE